MPARAKAKRVDRTQTPARSQDGTGLSQAVLTDIAPAIEAAVEEAAEAAAQEVQKKEPLELRTRTIELRRQSGTIVLEDTFEPDQVGAPVLVTLARSGVRTNEADLGVAIFTAEILNARQMRLTWYAISDLSPVVTIHYLIGRRSPIS